MLKHLLSCSYFAVHLAEYKQKWGVFMKKAFVLGCTGFIILGLYYFSPCYQNAELPIVQLSYPEVTAIQDTVTLHGSIVDPLRKKVYPKSSSKVLKVYVTEGATVKEGELLLRLQAVDSFQAEQSTATAVWNEFQETLAAGDFDGAESMLSELVNRSSTITGYQKELEVYELYSPCDGIIMDVDADDGDIISHLLPCVEITDPNDLQIQVMAGEEIVSSLTPNMACSIEIPAFSMTDIPGEVRQILPYAKTNYSFTNVSAPETTVCIQPDSTAANTLRPGYRATARINVSLRNDAMLLPYEAIQQDADGNEYVLRVEGARLVKQIIVTGAELEDYQEVCEGLTPYALIVQNPQADWEGASIKIASP